MSARRPQVYAAHPITSYDTPHAAARLAALRERLPMATVLDPEELFEGSEAWHVGWPGILAELDGLVVFAAEDGTIGLGCVREVFDALARGLPLGTIDDSGLRRLCGLRFLGDQVRTWRRTAQLVRGTTHSAQGFPGVDGDG